MSHDSPNLHRGLLADRLSGEGLRGLLVIAESSRDPDLAPFVGRAHLGSSFLVLPASDKARLGYLTPMERSEADATGLELLSPEGLGVEKLRQAHRSEGVFLAAVLQRGLEICEIGPGPIAIAGHPSAGAFVEVAKQLSAAGWELADGRELLLSHRKQKGERDLEAARAAAAGTGLAFRRVAGLLASCEASRTGELTLRGRELTAGRLRAEISRALAEYGLDQPEGNIVSCGPAAGVPHEQGDSSQILRQGEAVLVDLFPKNHVYADCTRTFCVGQAPDALEVSHETVRRALERSHASAAVGVSGWELQRQVCEFFESAGHPTPLSSPGTTVGYVHGLGHGVGFDIHEYPSFRRQAGEVGLLAEGDLLTLEPGLYYPDGIAGSDGFGVRLEDLVAITSTGPENLTPLPYELDPQNWNVG